MKFRLLFLVIFVCSGCASLLAQQARIDSLKGKLDYAGIIQVIDSLHTEDEDLLFEKVECLQKMGNMSDAIHSLQGLCEKTKKVKFYRELANYYNKIGNEKQALETLQSALEIEESNRLYYEVGKLQYNLRLFKEGVESCDKVLQNDTISNVLRLQSFFYKALDKTEEAKQLLKRGIVLNPKDYLSVVALGNMYKKDGEYKELVAITEKYLQKDSLNINVLSLNAFAYFNLHKYHKAKKLYEKLFELGFAPAENYFYLGYVYYRLGHYNDSYNSLLKANELAQGLNEAILYQLGVSCVKSLRYEEAILYLEKALQYYLPNNDKIKDICAYESNAYHLLGKFKKAVEMLKKGQKYKYSYRTLLNIGILYEQNKQFEKAKKQYQQLLKVLPSSSKNEKLKALRLITDSHLKFLKQKEFMERDKGKALRDKK